MVNSRLSTGLLFLLSALGFMILLPLVQATPFETPINDTTALEARSDTCRMAWSTNHCETPPDWTNTVTLNLNSVIGQCQTLWSDGNYPSVEFFKSFTLGPNCIGNSNANSITFWTQAYCRAGATDVTPPLPTPHNVDNNFKFTIQLSQWPGGRCADDMSYPMYFPTLPEQGTLQSYMFNS